MTHLLPVRPTDVGGANLTSQGAPKSVSLEDPLRSLQLSVQSLDDLRQQQAASLAYFDVFWLCAVLSAALVVLVLLMKHSVAEKGEHVGAEQEVPRDSSGNRPWIVHEIEQTVFARFSLIDLRCGSKMERAPESESGARRAVWFHLYVCPILFRATRCFLMCHF
jgi:hypothetical protein